MKYKFVFVVLVYKNTDVLDAFFRSLHEKVKDYKVVLVNSYYDDISLNKCSEYATLNDADFIPIQNKGYSYGNNIGIKHVKNIYDFDYLVISNSDIIIESLEDIQIRETHAIYAPDITLLNGKKQNPNIVFYSRLHFTLLDLAYKHKSRICLTAAHVFSRITREFFLFYNKHSTQKKYRIFSCHGSFFLITKSAVLSLYPILNEKMFLYNEEGYLAFNCKSKNIPIFYTPSLKVTHLEGASTLNNGSFDFERNYQSYTIMRECERMNNFVNFMQ